MSERRVPYTASVPRNRRRSQWDIELERALLMVATAPESQREGAIKGARAIINRAAARRRRGEE
jgi:hypothetical protein